MRIESFMCHSEIFTDDDKRIIMVTAEGIGEGHRKLMVRRAEICKSALEWAECLAECSAQDPVKGGG